MKKLLIIAFILGLGIILIGNKDELTNMAGKQMALTVASSPTVKYSSTPNPYATGQTNGTTIQSNIWKAGTGGVPVGTKINVPGTGVLGAATTTSNTSTAPVASTPQIDQALIGQFDQGIGNVQSAINRLGSQYNSGVSGIDSSYQNALNQLLLGRNQAQSSYDTNVQQNKTDYVGGKNSIRSQAGSALNGLLRLLGSRGAGGSSAATITAPGAVARQATLQQNELSNTFGSNARSLDTNWNNYLTGYTNQVNSATGQRDQNKAQFQREIDANRDSLLRTLATLSGQRASAAGGNPVAAAQPYLDQANQLADRNANYNVAPISYQTQAYNAPELSRYTSTPATPTLQGQSQSNDYYSPYLAALLGKKQQYA